MLLSTAISERMGRACTTSTPPSRSVSANMRQPARAQRIHQQAAAHAPRAC
ncbi:hypothetical protein [Cupriavidus basilensis]|uniref:hypothetical protein n=1 Tax=Cupriavidus basilensis TaxID=68895 RepID=UPI00130DCCD7|nr:hypothetical protein [Cupriavidus basilensis]